MPLSTGFSLEDFLEDIEIDLNLQESFGSGLEASLAELLVGLGTLGVGVAAFAAKDAISMWSRKRELKKSAVARAKSDERFEQLINELSSDEELKILIDLMAQLHGSRSKDAKYIAGQLSQKLKGRIEKFSEKRVIGALVKGSKNIKVESKNAVLLKEWIKLIITEGKFEDTVTKYPQYEPQLLTVKDENIHPKFYEWIVKQLKADVDISEIVDSIKGFEKNIQRLVKKDINGYSSVDELGDALESLGQSTRSKKTQVKSQGAEKIASEGTIDLYYIKNKDAAICYGAGTKWCITAKNAQHWEDYSGRNVLFYYAIDSQLEPTDPMHKVALAVIRDENDDNKIKGVDCYDAEDRQYSPKSVYKKIEGICKEHATGRESAFYGMKIKRGTLNQEDVGALISDFEKGLANTEQIQKISDVSILKQIYAAGVKLEKSNKVLGEDIYSTVIFRMIALKVPTDKIIEMVKENN
jgi:hypothetical protein